MLWNLHFIIDLFLENGDIFPQLSSSIFLENFIKILSQYPQNTGKLLFMSSICPNFYLCKN